MHHKYAKLKYNTNRRSNSNIPLIIVHQRNLRLLRHITRFSDSTCAKAVLFSASNICEWFRPAPDWRLSQNRPPSTRLYNIYSMILNSPKHSPIPSPTPVSTYGQSTLSAPRLRAGDHEDDERFIQKHSDAACGI